MTKADLSAADLSNADLRGVVFLETVLTRARLDEAKLGSAKLDRVDLREAYLAQTDFSGAELKEVDLRGALLWGTNFREAVLHDVNLEGAHLFLTDFNRAYLALSRETTLPGIESWFYVKNLASLRVAVHPDSLRAFQRLREDAKALGLRKEERDITAIIQRSRTYTHGFSERMFRYLLFDLPANWGASPGRPLLFVVAVILLLALPYSFPLWSKKKNGRGAIWRVWQTDRLLDRDAKNGHERLNGLPAWKAVVYGLYFSVLSAFHFGWRDLNVGNWIARIQPREYSLRPTGWVRVVSGVQSLLSVYLIALAALTYFGRPFE